MSSADLGPGRGLRLIVMGGGTGGHVFPALTVVRTLQARLAASGGIDVLWVGAAGAWRSAWLPRRRSRSGSVATGKIQRASNPLKLASPANLRDMGRVPLGVMQARTVVAEYRPDVVLATGGYVAVPVGLAAWLCRRPLVVHEQTVRLGLANRILARVAAGVAVSNTSSLELLPDAVRASAEVTGNPVRAQMLTGQADRAMKSLGWQGHDPALPTVYVTGGAQGSVQINTAVTGMLSWLLENANVVHQGGPDNMETLLGQASGLPHSGRYFLAGFLRGEVADVLALADVVISRSGAGTIAELTALGKAAVLIPLASSVGNEQAHNARYLQDAGAVVALEGEVSPGRLRAAVAPLLADPVARAAMADQARAFGRPDAAERLEDVVLAAAARWPVKAGSGRLRPRRSADTR